MSPRIKILIRKIHIYGGVWVCVCVFDGFVFKKEFNYLQCAVVWLGYDSNGRALA
jgi:hypothetical protein